MSPLFTWRSWICESGLPSTVRLVLFTLSLYMNERGGSAYPGAKRLADDSGLSVRSVKSALAIALEAGCIVETFHGGSPVGGQRKASEYRAVILKTGETDSRVQEIHRCNSQQGPVQLTTSTGAAAAPQGDRKATYKAAEARSYGRKYSNKDPGVFKDLLESRVHDDLSRTIAMEAYDEARKKKSAEVAS
jgi:hypothetical protein